MKTDEKRVWLPYRMTEPEELAAYYERMSAEGWHPVSAGRYTAKFRRGKPRELRYCVDFTDAAGEEELQRYTALCADAGWRFRLKARDGWLLFSSKNPDAEPLQTDPRLAAKGFGRCFWRNFLDSILFFLLWNLWIVLDLGINRREIVRYLSGWDTMLELCVVLLFFMLALFLLGNAAANLAGYFSARRAMKDGARLPEISQKAVRRRVRWRRALAWTAGILLAGALCYDIWAGNFRPAWEQWLSMGIGAAGIAGGFACKRRWLEGLARKFCWGAGTVFLALGLFLSYPLYRMEPVPFGPEDPVITVEMLLPGAELHQDEREYGHTPLYERWEVYQSGGVPVSENVSEGETVSCIAYRAATEGIARRLAWEEAETFRSVLHGTAVELDWGIDEALWIGDFYLVLRDGEAVIAYTDFGEPEERRELLLETLAKIRETP
ncbi:MAG TPA: DUF2812 domain-containing protein [Candidatus Merdivicinus faecavium]|nr:DUF2812 domain-containing protein [Candidatus Merdivicinus faecavium]